MSEVRMRDSRPEEKASGGKTGSEKDCRGICAARARAGATGDWEARAVVLVAR
jgi:hypothetical protein